MECQSLVSCEWLKEQIDQNIPGIRVLDGTWHMPPWKRNADEEYKKSHIPGAVRFDFSIVADKRPEQKQGLMLPPAEQFAQQVGEMGVSNDTHVVIYDNNEKFGMYSAGRVWWMFKIFGHTKLSILDGGIPKWISNGYPTVEGPQGNVSPVSYTPTFNPAILRNIEQVKAAFDAKNEQIIDGRPKGRFDGTAPEPNPKLRSGHILGSVNVPFTHLIDPQTKTLKSKEGIKQAFTSAGVDLEKPLFVSCGGAVVAGLLAFSLHQIGKGAPVYDGSWTDWVQNGPDETKYLGVKGEDL